MSGGGYIGRQFDEAAARKAVARVAGQLEEGERVVALLTAIEMSPTASILVVTSGRLLKLADDGRVVRSVRREEVEEAGVVKGAWTVQVVVRTASGREDWGTPDRKERDITHLELQAWWVGPGEELEGAGDEEKRAADGALLDRLLAEAREQMASTGGLMLDPSVREQIEAASPPGEQPSIVIAEGDGRRGALVGFSDRLAVIHSGATLLKYAETKDIIYDPAKDIISVLPVAGSPVRFGLSADAYAATRAQLDHLRSLLGPSATTSAVDPNALTDDLARLAQLHTSGALSDAEFAAAKRSLLGT